MKECFKEKVEVVQNDHGENSLSLPSHFSRLYLAILCSNPTCKMLQRTCLMGS